MLDSLNVRQPTILQLPHCNERTAWSSSNLRTLCLPFQFHARRIQLEPVHSMKVSMTFADAASSNWTFDLEDTRNTRGVMTAQIIFAGRVCDTGERHQVNSLRLDYILTNLWSFNVNVSLLPRELFTP